MSDTNLKNQKFGIKDKIGYAFGDFGNDFTFMLSSTFMMKFYTDVMLIDAVVVGLLMMLARFVDAFSDVIMGQIVDRSKPRPSGKFKPWILRMCGPVAIASFLIYQSEFAGMDYAFKVFWMFFTYLLWGSIFYTSINIPYGSMASAISSNPDHRTQLSSFRTLGATLATLVIGTGTPMFAYVVVDGATILDGIRMTFIAGIFSLCAIICYLLCYKLCTERVQVPQNTTKLNVVNLIKSIFTNRSLIGIICAALLLLLSQLSVQGFAPYIYPVYFGSAEGQSMFNLLSSLGTILISVPIASLLCKKFGKKEVSIAGFLFAAFVYAILYFVHPENVWIYAGFSVVAWISIQFFGAVIWAMIIDVIDDTEIKNGIREDGMVYSVYSFARKLGQAFSSGMIGAILTAIGYSATVASNPSAYPSVLHWIFNWSCWIPIVGFIAIALVLAFVYPLSKKRVDTNAAILSKK